jgi:uncharacterized repeat protein (TIGR02543 family)
MSYSLFAKNVFRAAVCAAFVLVLGGCFNPQAGNTGTLTINLGGSAGGSRSVHEWPPNNDMLKDIKYRITLSGSSGTINIEAEGGTVIKTTLAAGIWNITITAFLNGELYAEGSAAADVKAGQAASVTVPLRYAGEEPPEETFTVTFDSNEGSHVDAETVVKGGTVTRPANPTRSGYGFVRWYSDSALTAEYDFAAPVTGDIILYALWSAVTYTVTYNSNDGSPVDPAVVGEGGTATRPANPTRNGYGFDDWYSDANLTAKYDFDTPVNNNFTLYARWISPPLTRASDIVPYLAAQTGGNDITNTVNLPMQIDLGTMTQAGSGWRQLLDALETAGKYVNLDLSKCTMEGTEFNPDYSVITGKDKIVEIALPDAAESIADGDFDSAAFRNFTVLKSFSGTGLTSIGNCTFYNCTSLAQISLSEELTSIGEYAFKDCTSLTEISLPTGIVSFGYAPFHRCTNLTSISLPASLNITGNLFYGCTSITSFTVIGDGPLSVIEGGKALVRNNTELVLYPSASGSVTLPIGFTSIGSYAFSFCNNLTQITLPAGFNSIGDYAFENCTNLDLTELPAGITSIGEEAFRLCTSLALAQLPAGLSSISEGVFIGCTNLALTKLPEGLTSIGKNAFNNCINLTQITLPAGITSIDWYAFRDCNNLTLITCLTLTPPIEPRGGDPKWFDGTSELLQIKVPASSVDEYKTAAGWSDYADRISGLPLTTVNDVAPYLAAQSGGNSVTAPVNLPMRIDLGTMTQASSGWRQLLNVIETAGKYVNLDLSVCTMTGTEFNPDYNIATGKDKIVEIALPDTAESIADGTSSADITFKNFTALKSFSGSGLTSISNFAFRDCTSLALTSLPVGITSIGEAAFYGCTNLALTSLPTGFTTISQGAFMNCTNLALTSLPSGITSVSSFAFFFCEGLEQIELPAGLESIGQQAFYGCTSLALVTCLATTPPTLETGAFASIPSSLQIKVPAASVNAYKAAAGWSDYADKISGF